MVFSKLLIAARGEAVARIARTCRRVGVETVIACTKAEAELAEQTCDVLVPVERHSIETYLEVARTVGVDAVHPGYASMHEQRRLRSRFEELEGLTFVGAPSAAIDTCSNRIRVAEIGRDLGLRVLPTARISAGSMGDARRSAEEVGYPVILRSALAGLPFPIAIADDEENLDQCLPQIEAADIAMIVQRHLPLGRHLEIAVVADQHGQAAALGERETSIRWNHLRMLSEAPSPELFQRQDGGAVREALVDASQRLAVHLGIQGAATVDVLLDADDRVWFLGARTGLSSEHGVTDAVTSLDTVELELRIARGEHLPDETEWVDPSGHAFDAQVLAYDLRTGRRSEGSIDELRWPPAPQGRVRVETNVAVGSLVGSGDDDSLARVHTFAPGRHQALLALDRVLAEFHVSPLATNVALLRRVLAHDSFRAGQYDLEFVDRLDRSDSERPENGSAT